MTLSGMTLHNVWYKQSAHQMYTSLDCYPFPFARDGGRSLLIRTMEHPDRLFVIVLADFGLIFVLFLSLSPKSIKAQ